VGRLVERKGHATVLRALPKILETIPGLEYTIVGEGPLRDELKRFAEELGIQRNVRFLGGVGEKELLEIYSRSDCFVMANQDNPERGDTEGFGIVFAEASAHGLPVIGGRSGGTAHSIIEGRTGLRVDGRDPDEVARAILEILTHPERAEVFGHEGRRFAQTELRWDARVEEFQAILAGHGNPV
jgi:phosphatidylinositol alpha-1,6-mannosyltransferase